MLILCVIYYNSVYFILFYLTYRCDSCKEKNSEHCYHWNVGDEDSVLHFQEDLSIRLEEYVRTCGRQFVDVQGQSEILYNPAEVNHFGNKYNIDFDHSSDNNDESDIIFFNTLVVKELTIRQLEVIGNLDERKRRLRQHLMMEERLAKIKEAILRTREGKEVSLILIKQAIPCIMHLENCAGENFLTIVLSIGATRYQRERGEVLTLMASLHELRKSFEGK
jgi:hypothetical protein